MSEMIRKTFYITSRQDALLKRLAQLRGVSEAEIIRKAIESQLSGSAQPISGNRSAIDDFARLALSKRSRRTQGEPYRWNREEIYAERESRWLQERDE